MARSGNRSLYGNTIEECEEFFKHRHLLSVPYISFSQCAKTLKQET